MTDNGDLPDVSGYKRIHVAIATLVGLLVMVGSYVWAQNFRVNTEEIYRVNPTVDGGGIGSDWVAGNSAPVLDFLIALIHAADVLMGVFILVMVFIHWAAFRRLADRMQQPGQASGEAVAADGGQPTDDPSADAGSDTDATGGGEPE